VSVVLHSLFVQTLNPNHSSQSMTIPYESIRDRLSRDDIDRRVKEAEELAEQDEEQWRPLNSHHWYLLPPSLDR
jgi:hypothetical protein